ncbi:MAG: host-nuclease inhibitor Gam family protein [Proteobacteria bacterium]|nr:host-nuclease inhibitor Gam family protein [Pseudomonadota bacterium]
MATTKLKAKAQTYAPQTPNDCAADIKKLGDLQRDFARQQADMNDEIAAITKRYQPKLEALSERIATLQQGVQTYCEANRSTLTNDGKVKTANFVTGDVQWRQRPPSVSIRGADAVIEVLQRMGLSRFVRTKEEVNKEAILNEPDAVRGIAGISVVTGVEDFVISPFEAAAEAR